MRHFWKKKVPAFLLALLMVTSLVPMAGAASTLSIEEEVAAGKEVTLNHGEFKTLFDSRSNEDIYYVEFTDAGKMDDYGHFVAIDYDGNECTLDADDLEDQAWFYYYTSDVPEDIDYRLKGLTFVADKNAKDGSFVMDFVIKGDEGDDDVIGILEITVGGGGADDYDIVYEVEAGEETLFDAEDFYDFFDAEYNKSSYHLKYVVFDAPSSSALADGDLYYNYGSSGQVKFTRTNIASCEFYYSSDVYGDYPLDDLAFVADDDFEDDVELTFTAYSSSSRYVTGTLLLTADADSDDSDTDVDGDIVYEVEEDDEVSLDPDDFEAFYESKQSGTFSYIRFTDITNLDDTGALTTFVNDDGEWEEVSLDEEDALDGFFYFDDDDVEDAADTYCLDGLSFESDDRTDGEVVVLEFTAYGTTSSKKAYGTLVIEIGDVKSSSSSKSDLEYEVQPDGELEFDEEDFNDLFRETYSGTDFKYLYFTGVKNLGSTNGNMYYKYGRAAQEQFSVNTLKNAYFYYDEDDIPEDDDSCYALEDLSFVAGSQFSTAVELTFTAYYSSSKQVTGTVTISPKGSSSAGTSGTTGAPATSSTVASIVYTTTPGTNVQLKANDFARFFESKIIGSTFQSVKLLGVPATGSLYYNYSGASPYGTAARLQLTAYNCGSQILYPSPVSTTQYALTELTFVPAANTTNYTASIPFAASGTGGYTVYGSVMISVTSKAIPEIYGVTPKNTAVPFPATSISSAVSTGTSATLLGIQLLELPASSVGSIYVGSTNARKATTGEVYAVSGNSWTISQLRFVPANGYTGNVEIPYLAYDTNLKTVGVGTFSLGIVNSQVKFSDVNASTWCYKYVAELSDAKIISGYADGSFKPGNTISYGAALKLIMLAAGYSEQAPTVKGSTFSGYLAKAQAEGIVTRTNVNLSAPITRLQVAQLAAGAMKLDLNNLSSVKPFTDTADKHVQALNDLGIMQGFTNTTFGPNSTLTRGQVSAIVWRMQNYQ